MSFTTFAVTLTLLTAPSDVPHWPAFLGQGATEIATDSLPVEWSPTKNIAWQAATPGHGQSSPVVWGDQVFLTAVDGPNKETNLALCYSLTDGKELWRKELASSFEVPNNVYVSRAAPTPCCDAERVYCYFESGDVVAFTHAGEPVWQKSITKEFGAPQNKFGLSASPAQTDDAIFVLVDDEGPSYLLALSKADGSILWKADRTSRVSWSSPAIVPFSGMPRVAVSSAGTVDVYDPKTGKRLLWLEGGIGGNTAATPVPFGDGKFLVAASPGQSGERTEEAKQSNFALAFEPIGGGQLGALRREPFAPRVLWRTEKAFPSFGSPIVHNGYAYWVNRQGVVYCFDAATGESQYTERAGESIWATPLGVGDPIYLFGKDGLTTVIAAGPEFKVLAENRLWSEDEGTADPKAGANLDDARQRASAAMFGGRIQYGVAAVNGSLLIRTGDVLYCVRKEQ